MRFFLHTANIEHIKEANEIMKQYSLTFQEIIYDHIIHQYN